MSAIASGAINGDMPSDTSPSALPGAPHPASNTNGTSGSPTGRNLIICIDGSGNHYGPPDSNTNVIKLFNLFQQSTATQVCYYQPGIGAGESNGVNRLAVAVQKRVDFAIATHLEVQVTDAYKWLMDTWEDGDRVYMFGFSRGSYICRALAGMLQRVGLLGAGNFHNVPFAYRIFSKPRSPANDALARGFKATFARLVRVEFIGVFDTVSSVGLFVPQSLPFTSGNTHVKTFRHAISIDECRVRFQDNLWSGNMHEEEQINALGHVEVATAHGGVFLTDIQEVWFAGTHSDVGGGWGDDKEPSAAALAPLPMHSTVAADTNVNGAGADSASGPFTDAAAAEQEQPQGPCNMSVLPLRWMAREALAAGVLMKPSPLSTLRHSSPIDPLAACSTLHNTLPAGSVWWVLEYIPQLTTARSSTDAKQVYGLTVHMGAARKIPEGAKLHRSVQVRRERMGYTPAGGWPEAFEFVD